MWGLICGLILYHAEAGFLAQYAGDAELAWFVGIAIVALTPPNAYYKEKEKDEEEDTNDK